ncbi:ATP-binding protein [Solimonas aquatica]|nr:ATP-binding protein [Solimonas aquatica]
MAIASSLRGAARRSALIRLALDSVGRQNMIQMVQLRWIAVIGQILTIVYVVQMYEVRLPLVQMANVISILICLNLFSLFFPQRNATVYRWQIFFGLCGDVAVLTALLYCSGGATNPFVFLYLLQVTLAAMLLDGWLTWMIVGLTTVCFTALTKYYQPLQLPEHSRYTLFELHILGMLVCFALNAGLLVIFVNRITSILRGREERLAELRQREVEEDLIVRMGLLASGAAHELGTPLATLSVILGDWRRMPEFRDRPELLEEIGDMEEQVRRCKTIVTGILLSAGEARGESLGITTPQRFMDELVAEWRAKRHVPTLDYDFDQDAELPADLSIVSDSALKQVICNVLDNALEASPQWLAFEVRCTAQTLSMQVRDFGRGFAPEILAQLGKPYQSTKGKPGGGLGLFLVVNVIRKLGGSVTAENLIGGGALVSMSLPLASLAIGGSHES